METSIIVQNLKCGGCANTITKKLSELEGITSVLVDKDKSEVTFHCNSSEELEMVKRQLKTLGYPSIDDDNSISSKMKSMVSCATGKLS